MASSTSSGLQNTHYGTFSPEYKDFLENHDLSAMEGMAHLSPAQARPVMATIEKNGTPPWKDIDTKERSFRTSEGAEIGIRVWKSTKPSLKTGRAPLAYILHGGGWIYGGHDSEPALIRVLVERFGCIGVTVDYRLAPEHPFPTPFQDAYEGLRWVIDNALELGADPKKIVIAGASAGSNLAAAVALKACEENVEGIIGQVLILPATCHYAHYPSDKYELASFDEFSGTPLLNKEMMQSMWDMYNPRCLVSPYISPLLAADHTGLPPAYIQVAGADPLRDEGLAYAKCLKNAGVDVKLDIFSGYPHGFQTDILGMEARHKCTQLLTAGYEWLVKRD